jgi:GntR family transcriptional regulator of abcA and norABC
MLIHSTGANMLEYSIDRDGPLVDSLLPRLRRSKRPLLYVQPVNHNPTGVCMSKERRTLILAACKELGVPIIENDMFRDFVFDRNFPRPLKAFDNSGQVIYIGSFLSCFMGFKLSWIIAPEFIIERLNDSKKHHELMSNVLVEIIAEEIFKSGTYYSYLESIRPLMLRQYNEISVLLQKYLSDKAEWYKNMPAYFIWLKFNKCIEHLSDRNYSGEYLFFPGMIFDWKDCHHARLNTLGSNYEELETWISSIAKLV